MCLAAIAIQANPYFPFVCVANRDEFHNRPTAPLHAWSVQGCPIHAGKDLQSEGTWLGVSEQGRFALLTNVRKASLNRNDAPSRGELVTRALRQPLNLSTNEASQYSGYNLIQGNLIRQSFCYSTNQHIDSPGESSKVLVPGIHALSNGSLESNWPKTTSLKNGLSATLGELKRQPDANEFTEQLLALLANTSQAQDEDLPNTGVPYEWEKMLSAKKIVSPAYGTRSSAVITVDAQSMLCFTEISFNSEGKETGRRTVQFELAAR